MAEPALAPSRQTLDELPGRAITFLRAIGTSPAIRAIMAQGGYKDATHRQGWALVHASSGYEPPEGPSAGSTELDPVVRDAIVRLDRWDEPNFARFGAALEHLHPEAYRFVFDKLEPGQGAQAVVTVQTFLDRVDVLQHGSDDRKAQRKQDRAALETLEERGLTEAVRKALRADIEIAEKGTAPAETVADARAEKKQGEQEAALLKLYAWYKDWSTTARALITRRDYLIRLGLAKRKSRKPEKGDPGGSGGGGPV